jgi:hypothetical protein
VRLQVLLDACSCSVDLAGVALNDADFRLPVKQMAEDGLLAMAVLLQDDMGVGASKSEGIHTGSSRRLIRCMDPWARFGVNVEGRFL